MTPPALFQVNIPDVDGGNFNITEFFHFAPYSLNDAGGVPLSRASHNHQDFHALSLTDTLSEYLYCGQQKNCLVSLRVEVPAESIGYHLLPGNLPGKSQDIRLPGNSKMFFTLTLFNLPPKVLGHGGILFM